MGFLRSLFSANDAAADSLIVGGGIALLTLIAFTIYSVASDPHSFNPLSFGSGAATILGAVGAGKGVRDFGSRYDQFTGPNSGNPQ